MLCSRAGGKLPSRLPQGILATAPVHASPRLSIKQCLLACMHQKYLCSCQSSPRAICRLLQEMISRTSLLQDLHARLSMLIVQTLTQRVPQMGVKSSSSSSSVANHSQSLLQSLQIRLEAAVPSLTAAVGCAKPWVGQPSPASGSACKRSNSSSAVRCAWTETVIPNCMMCAIAGCCCSVNTLPCFNLYRSLDHFVRWQSMLSWSLICSFS